MILGWQTSHPIALCPTKLDFLLVDTHWLMPQEHLWTLSSGKTSSGQLMRRVAFLARMAFFSWVASRFRAGRYIGRQNATTCLLRSGIAPRRA